MNCNQFNCDNKQHDDYFKLNCDKCNKKHDDYFKLCSLCKIVFCKNCSKNSLKRKYSKLQIICYDCHKYMTDEQKFYNL